LVLSLFIGCENSANKTPSREPALGDLQDIVSNGKLRVLMDNSTVSYFNYRDKEIGFEYELLQNFCKDLGVELEVTLINNYDDIQKKLDNNEVDLVACNYTINSESNKTILFSNPYLRTDLVLVQRLKTRSIAMDKNMKEIDLPLLDDPIQLARKHVSVRRNSNQMMRLQNLQEEIGDTIYVNEEASNVSTEDLLELVSNGKIDFTIAERNLSDASKNFYPNLSSEVSLGIKQNIAFGMRTNSLLLKSKVDKWLDKFMSQPAFGFIKKKYFIQTIEEELPLNVQKLSRGALSSYDGFFKSAAKKHNFDWRLLAAVSYKESKFNPRAHGYGGAYGMMQFMPGTGPSFGVYEDSPPQVQINGGMSYLSRIYKLWKNIPDVTQRQKFMLASYNAGPCHIEDAKRLASKYGFNPLIWDNNVEIIVSKLSQSAYYKDELVKCGSMRGQNTVGYVRNIMANYERYKGKYRP
jgi:membrane-bound lytic murein transglycosylase F